MPRPLAFALFMSVTLAASRLCRWMRLGSWGHRSAAPATVPSRDSWHRTLAGLDHWDLGMLPSPQQRPPPSRSPAWGLAQHHSVPLPQPGALTFRHSLASPWGPRLSWIQVLCLPVLGGAGWDCREPGCPPLSLKKGRLPRAGLGWPCVSWALTPRGGMNKIR